MHQKLRLPSVAEPGHRVDGRLSGVGMKEVCPLINSEEGFKICPVFLDIKKKSLKSFIQLIFLTLFYNTVDQS